jgi:hypothetical protein
MVVVAQKSNKAVTSNDQYELFPGTALRFDRTGRVSSIRHRHTPMIAALLRLSESYLFCGAEFDGTESFANSTKESGQVVRIDGEMVH